jgi:hypothetical protein
VVDSWSDLIFVYAQDYRGLFAIAPNVQYAFEELDKAVAEARELIKKRFPKSETPN